MSNPPAKDFGSNSQEEDISDGTNRGTKRKHCNASRDPPQLGVKLPRMNDIQSPTKDRNRARLPVDILLLTVKDCEFLACYMQLNNPFRCWFDGLGFVYFGDENEGQEEKVKVALLRCHEGSSGPGGSIVTTKNAVSVLMPKAVILVGTCGSLRPEETKLGDVVISAKLTTYGLKVVTNDKELHNNIRTFASKRFLDLIKDLAFGWEAPLENSEDREVKIHSRGELLSVPEVINTESRRKQLAETFPLAVAVDTEAEGNEILGCYSIYCSKKKSVAHSNASFVMPLGAGLKTSAQSNLIEMSTRSSLHQWRSSRLRFCRKHPDRGSPFR